MLPLGPFSLEKGPTWHLVQVMGPVGPLNKPRKGSQGSESAVEARAEHLLVFLLICSTLLRRRHRRTYSIQEDSGTVEGPARNASGSCTLQEVHVFVLRPSRLTAFSTSIQDYIATFAFWPAQTSQLRLWPTCTNI